MAEDPLQDIKKQLGALRKSVGDAAKQSSAVADQLPKIVDRIATLEINVRAVAGHAKQVELNTWPELSDDVITQCRDHFTLELGRDERTLLTLTEAKKAKARYQREYEEAIRAAKRFTRPTRGVRHAKGPWDSFVVTAQRARPNENLEKAERAHAEYARERSALDARKPVADQALATVRKVVRDRIEDALEHHQVLPQWFYNALGPYTPNTSNDWLKTGVDLVVYRIVFGVTSRLYLFEDKPSGAAQEKEFKRLKELCEKHKTM